MFIGHLYKLKKNQQVYFSIKCWIFPVYVHPLLPITIALPLKDTKLQDLGRGGVLITMLVWCIPWFSSHQSWFKITTWINLRLNFIKLYSLRGLHLFRSNLCMWMYMCLCVYMCLFVQTQVNHILFSFSTSLERLTQLDTVSSVFQKKVISMQMDLSAYMPSCSLFYFNKLI